MRILFLSFFFPPYNTIGAVRTGATARYLTESGHDVQVISASPQALTDDLPLRIPRERVIYTRWIGRRSLKRLPDAVDAAAADAAAARRSVPLAKKLYWELMIPDQQLGWFPFAFQAARSAIGKKEADIIFASASPLTSLLVARSLSRFTGIPWVAELRDAWMDHAYRPEFLFRDYLERPLERRTLGDADGLVTVTVPLASALEAQYRKPVKVVFNGYEPQRTPAEYHPDPDRLVIRHTGSMYNEKRVPHSLFRALRELGAAKHSIVVEFYGADLEHVEVAAAASGVQDVVRCRGTVRRDESLRLQRDADILLLASSPSERDGLTGKLFEYLNARRPVLLVGCPDGAAADLVRSTGCGFVAENVDDMKAQLLSWRATKSAHGRITDGPPPPERFTHLEQTRVLAEFLETIASHHPARRGRRVA
jgi:glycosyltransferase involved in cell wall biosynthesis